MIWNVDPVLLSLGPLTIRWYGLFFVIGFLIGYRAMVKIFSRDGYPLETLDSLLVYLIVGTTLGARLGHCFFYEPEYYLSKPWEIFAIWKGGLASHGGFIGVAIATALFCRRFKMPFLYVVDKISFLALFTGGFIRLGNLMNSEILGRPTDLPWGVIFSRVDSIARHPTQIYESLSYFLISLVAWGMERKWHKKLPQGFLLGFILCFGFLARFLIEFFKENQESFEQGMLINMGQILSVVPVLIGICLMVWSWKKGEPEPEAQRESKVPAQKKKRKSR